MRRLIFVFVLAGCGSVPNKNPNDMAMGMGDMTGGGGSGGGGGGDLATAPQCTAGMPCQSGSGNGLCSGGTCNACTDTTDDAMCATVYGAGNICLNGACAPGCRSAADCGGQPCTNNVCGSATCMSDGDCDPSQVCNTTMSMCVAGAGSCGAVTNGACPINPSDVCCTPSTTCTPGNCCGSGACTVVAANDGTCMAGNCVLNSCGAPPASTRYVDFSAAAGGSGSMACPFSDIGPAVASLPAAGGTVLVKGGAAGIMKNISSHALGNIKLVSTDASFAACTAATCGDATMWPTLKVGGNFYGIKFTAGTKATNAFEYFNLTGPGSTTSTNSGLSVTGAAVAATIDHVSVSGFQQGLLVNAGGTAYVGSGSVFNNNKTGANIQSASGAGGNLDVTVASGDANVTFSNNDLYGIYCEGGTSATDSGVVKISAPPWASGSTPQVRANSNGSSGVRLSSLAASTITGLVADGNGGGTDSSIYYRDGITIFAKSNVKVRSSHFGNSSDSGGTMGNGVHIVPSGKDVAGELANIDLGKANDAGLNTFNGNKGAGLCLDAGPSSSGGTLLPAYGNKFDGGAKDCSTTAATLTFSSICYGGVNVSSACHASENVNMCTLGTCK